MKSAYQFIQEELEKVKVSGLWKDERIITSPQQTYIDTINQKSIKHVCKQLSRIG